MSEQMLLDRLQEIFRDNFDNERIIISRETIANDIEGWDSLEQINLLTAIEAEFEIRFKLSDVSHLENVGDMMDVVIQKMGEVK